MTAYNFSEEFAIAVEAGLKLQTIRQSHKGAKIGGTAQLYTAQRTKQCRLLRTGTITAITPVTLYEEGCDIAGKFYVDEEIPNIIARADGFATYLDMAEWFREKYNILDLDEKPFDGFIHAWKLNEVINGRD